jgi:hypothetical protein
VAKIRASGTTPLSGTNVEVVRLTATVPASAPYGASQAIRLENVAVNSGAIAAVGDVAVHKAAYLGDADGSGIHSAADAFLVVQAALGLASGFSAHAWTDPRIVGDADGSGQLSAADAFLIVQEGLGLAEPFVPDNPHITVVPVGGGVDPQFRIGVNLPATAGGQVSVPVNLDIEPAATNVGAFAFDVFFDPTQLTIQVPDGVAAGADTAGSWTITATSVAAGRLHVEMMNARGQPLVPGLREVARLQFRVEDATVDAPLRDANPLAERAVNFAPLDIEPVDPRAGGYTWTAEDGSVAIAASWDNAASPFDVNDDQAYRALDVLAAINHRNAPPELVAEGEPGKFTPAPLAANSLMDKPQSSTEHMQHRLLRDLEAKLPLLEEVLDGLADDIASARRCGFSMEGYK